MKNSSAIVFRENYRLSELSQIISYLQQLAASGINVASRIIGYIMNVHKIRP